jgi:hypothetical protein
MVGTHVGTLKVALGPVFRARREAVAVFPFMQACDFARIGAVLERQHGPA